MVNKYRWRYFNEVSSISATGDVSGELSVSLYDAIDSVRSACSDCGACKTQCAFLQEYGTPVDIIAKYDFSQSDHQYLAFECSLCNLCSAVCPEKLKPGELFYAIRREATARGNINLSRYRGILGYEKHGSSPLFSYYGLPEGCDTVFFPGCSLPGTRPETTWQIYKHLQRGFPALGIILDCCTKPSHDLGRHNYFEKMFGKMRQYLIYNNIRKVLVACPNCYLIFKRYGNGLDACTIYEVISSGELPAGATGIGQIVVHDPCPLRQETVVQDSVRLILTRIGLNLSEMKHRRELTRCCGEGGSVGFVRPVLAQKWGKICRDGANDRKIVTCCAGCAGILNRLTPTVHIADVLFSTDKAINGGLHVARSPFTYINRLKLKHRIKADIESMAHRVQSGLFTY